MALMGVIVALTLAFRGAAQSTASSEYDVKAAFLFHFAQFVE